MKKGAHKVMCENRTEENKNRHKSIKTRQKKHFQKQ